MYSTVSTLEDRLGTLTQASLFVDTSNQHPKPFKWTATADSSLDILERLGKVIDGTRH